jgi:hypothetical protein
MYVQRVLSNPPIFPSERAPSVRLPRKADLMASATGDDGGSLAGVCSHPLGFTVLGGLRYPRNPDGEPLIGL